MVNTFLSPLYSGGSLNVRFEIDAVSFVPRFPCKILDSQSVTRVSQALQLDYEAKIASSVVFGGKRRSQRPATRRVGGAGTTRNRLRGNWEAHEPEQRSLGKRLN